LQGDEKLLAAHEKLQSLQAELAAALDAERMRSTEASTHMEAARRLRDERDRVTSQLEQCKVGLTQATANTDKLRAGVRGRASALIVTLQCIWHLVVVVICFWSGCAAWKLQRTWRRRGGGKTSSTSQLKFNLFSCWAFSCNFLLVSQLVQCQAGLANDS
jgi:hypothetical protein